VDVAFLCGPSLDEFQHVVVTRFLSGDSGHRIVGCVIDARSPPSSFERLRTNLSRGRGGYLLIMALNRMRARRGTKTSSEAFFRASGVPIITTKDPYSDETHRQVGALRPDVLLLLGGFGIIKPPLLNLAPEGVLSYHHGDMRRYRGQPPAFWELYEGDDRVGVTVQRLSVGLDRGEPIVERTFAVQDGDTLGSIRRRIFADSTDMMLEAVQRLEDPSFRAEKIECFGHVYTLPNLREWFLLQARVGRRALRARISARKRWLQDRR
jgi:folate-dependent phosphoribosylglycinamide formyltransferase PurN